MRFDTAGSGQPDRLFPLSFQASELTSNAAGNWFYFTVGRLKPGVTPRQARDDAELAVNPIKALRGE